MPRVRLSMVVALLGIALVRCGASNVVVGPPSSPSTSPPPAKVRRTSILDGDASALPHYDWIGIVGTGQSLAVGSEGRPILTTAESFDNLKLLDDDDAGTRSLIPLNEPIRPLSQGSNTEYPNNILGETPHSSMANQLTVLALGRDRTNYVTLHSVVGWGAHCMSDIDKIGLGHAYPGTISEARTFKELAYVQGKTFGYGAVLLTHGECDSSSADYEADIVQMWRDYNTDLREITGQKEEIPLLLSQQNTFPLDETLSLSTLAQLSAGLRFPGRIVCVGPKYQYAYSGDKVHLDAAGYRRLGEKYAEVLDQIFRLQNTWTPLQPTSATRNGLVITVTFDVPNPPLAWDETLAPPHQSAFTAWAAGRGFEVADERGPVRIASVRIRRNDVILTLGAAPEGTPVTVRYAMVQDGQGAQGGNVLGRRGQLRDSDPFVGWDAEKIPCSVEQGSNEVTAEKPLTFARRTLRDVVSGTGLPSGTIVTEKISDTILALSSPWTGPTGAANIAFHYDQRNYAVAFQIHVP